MIFAARVIDDPFFSDLFVRKMLELPELPGGLNAAGDTPVSEFALPMAEGAIVPTPGNIYEDCLPAVVLVGAISKCQKCPEWHSGGFAGGWIASPEGHVVTNQHVVEKFISGRLGVMTSDGRVFPVVSVCASDETADAAVLKIDPAGEALPFLRLAADVKQGDPVTVLSHPDGRLWYLSKGVVARFSKGNEPGNPVWMNITADYAVGSSGCPVLNDDGAVVGMVSRTSTLFTGPASSRSNTCQSAKGSPQMVVKECVPLSVLRRFFCES